MTTAIQSMLRRVAKLEVSRSSRFAALGTPEFEEQFRADVVERVLDRTDLLGPCGTSGVLAALQRWAREL